MIRAPYRPTEGFPTMRARDPLSALSLVQRSVEAVRNARALYVRVGTFAMAGLRVAGAESSLARGACWWGPVLTGAALFVAFYGGNAAGVRVVDDDRGALIREVPDALRTSFFTAHCLLLALLLSFAAYALVAAVQSPAR